MVPFCTQQGGKAGLGVCVCVCVREREREIERGMLVVKVLGGEERK